MSKEKASRQRQLKGLVEQLQLDQLAGFSLDLNLLDQAFHHPSYIMEKNVDAKTQGERHSSNIESNQRLEFLGDAVLGLVTAQALYHKNPSASEGELTKLRAALVCERSLAQAARQYNLGSYLLMGRGIAQSGGAQQASVLADTFEALLGVLFLCGVQVSALEAFIFRAVQAVVEQIEEGIDEDFKGQLQAWVQRTNERQLSYRILDEQGPDHQKIFLAGAFLDDEEIGRGRGCSKQEAQKQAAKLALHRLKHDQL